MSPLCPVLQVIADGKEAARRLWQSLGERWTTNKAAADERWRREHAASMLEAYDHPHQRLPPPFYDPNQWWRKVAHPDWTSHPSPVAAAGSGS
jgi:hypothetical protein